MAQTHLIAAVKRGSTAALLRAIADGDSLDALDASGSTALCIAVRGGRADLAQCLLSAGADPGLPQRFGATPLILAALRPDPAIVRLLVSAGASPDAPDASGRTALTLCARRGLVDMASLLAELGADLDRQDSHGRTALVIAYDCFAAEMAERLADLGASLDSLVEYSQGAIMPIRPMTGARQQLYSPARIQAFVEKHQMRRLLAADADDLPKAGAARL